MTTLRPRVLVIGMDGATLDLAGPWMEQGFLPNLERLARAGAAHRLKSTLQPATAPAWASILTGVNQGKHGLYDFVQRRPGQYDVEITNASHIMAPTFLDLTSAAGLRVASVNMPYTFPPRPLNGVVVAGPFASAVTEKLVSPPEFLTTLNAICPDYFVLPDYDPNAPDPADSFAKALVQEVAQREAVALTLLQDGAWDLFCVVFMATDIAQHTFWPRPAAQNGSQLPEDMGTIRSIYERIDSAIGKILAQCAATANGREVVTIVLSDHGAGPFRRMVNLNRWLASEGFLACSAGPQSLAPRWRRAVTRGLAEAYRQLAPSWLRGRIRRAIGQDRFDSLKGVVESSALQMGIDWQKTRAYASGAGGNIYINQEDREPMGKVRPGAEYNALISSLQDRLRELRDPMTGRTVVHAVHQAADIYNGPFLSQAPDLVIEWEDYAYWGRAGDVTTRGEVFETADTFDFSRQPLTGSHRPYGMLIVSPSSSCQTHTDQSMHLWDICPTVLSLLGVPLPDHLDGQSVCLGVENRENTHSTLGTQIPPDETGSASYGYSGEDERRITEHLRSLGYL